MKLELETKPPEDQSILESENFALKYNGNIDPPLIPAIINPEKEGIDVERFRTFSLLAEAAVDHDGSPTAYMPGDKGSDYLQNGKDEDGVPVGFKPHILNEDGGYLSTTKWSKGNPEKQSSYVDSRRVPYVVLPDSYYKDGGKFGDFVRLRNKTNGKETWAVVADSRKHVDKIEMSIAACRQLDIGFNKVGTTKNYKTVSMVAFKGSATGRWY